MITRFTLQAIALVMISVVFIPGNSLPTIQPVSRLSGSLGVGMPDLLNADVSLRLFGPMKMEAYFGQSVFWRQVSLKAAGGKTFTGNRTVQFGLGLVRQEILNSPIRDLNGIEISIKYLQALTSSRLGWFAEFHPSFHGPEMPFYPSLRTGLSFQII